MFKYFYTGLLKSYPLMKTVKFFNKQETQSIKVEITYQSPKFFGRSISELISYNKNMYPISHLTRLASAVKESSETGSTTHSEITTLITMIEDEKIQHIQKSDYDNNPLNIHYVLWLWLILYPGYVNCISLDDPSNELQSILDVIKIFILILTFILIKC